MKKWLKICLIILLVIGILIFVYILLRKTIFGCCSCCSGPDIDETIGGCPLQTCCPCKLFK